MIWPPHDDTATASGRLLGPLGRRLRSAFRDAADILFLLRPVLLGPVWTIYGAGALMAGGRPGPDLVFVSLLVGGVYVHNQLTDVETDRENRKLFLIGEGHVSRKTAWWTVGVAWTLALSWAATLGSGAHGERFLLYLSALALGLLYNALPVPWKSRPWRGLLTNVLAHGPVTFLAGWTAIAASAAQSVGDQGTLSILSGAAASIPYGAAVGAVYLATTIVDRAGDEKTGKVTMAVRYGERPTAWMVCALVLLAVVTADIVNDPWMAGAAAASSPIALVLALHAVPKAAGLTAKVAVSALALAVAFRWPPLVLLAAITFFGARLYYRRRFGVRYPNFGAGE